MIVFVSNHRTLFLVCRVRPMRPSSIIFTYFYYFVFTILLRSPSPRDPVTPMTIPHVFSCRHFFTRPDPRTERVLLRGHGYGQKLQEFFVDISEYGHVVVDSTSVKKRTTTNIKRRETRSRRTNSF